MNRMKISMAIHKGDAQSMAAAMARMDYLKLTPPRDRGGTEWHDMEERLSDLDRHLQKFMDSLGIPKADQSRFSEMSIPAEELKPTLERIEGETKEMEGRFQNLEDEKKGLNERLNRIGTVAENSQRLKDAGIDMQTVNSLHFLHVELGWIPADQVERIDIRVIQTPVVILPIFQWEDNFFITASTLRKNAYVLRRILDSVFFEPIEELPTSFDCGKEAGQAAKLENRRQELESYRTRIVENWRDKLITMHRQVEDTLAWVHIIDNYGRPGEMYVFTGFIPEDRLEMFHAAIRETAEHPHTLFTEKIREAG